MIGRSKGDTMSDPTREVTVNAADLEAVLDGQRLGAVRTLAHYAAADRLRAAVAPPAPPWEPSEQDITDYCEAKGWASSSPKNRSTAENDLIRAHERGFDARVVRLDREWTDEQAAAFWRCVANDVEHFPQDFARGKPVIDRLEAAGWRLSPPEGEK